MGNCTTHEGKTSLTDFTHINSCLMRAWSEVTSSIHTIIQSRTIKCISCSSASLRPRLKHDFSESSCTDCAISSYKYTNNWPLLYVAFLQYLLQFCRHCVIVRTPLQTVMSQLANVVTSRFSLNHFCRDYGISTKFIIKKNRSYHQRVTTFTCSRSE